MFKAGPNYTKLKTNLRLAINRLKLLEKKKTELAQKARKEIADYLAAGKIERAKIRVEHIIREDYLVEAMEVTEMYCDLLLARFGLIQQMKDLDDGMAEAISSLIWACPRLQTDVAELKIIAEQLSLKYGKPYAEACVQKNVNTISEKLIHKLSVQAPPKILIERYLVEIAKNYNIDYEPDPQVMHEDECTIDPLICLDDGKNNLDNEGASSVFPPGVYGFPNPPNISPPFNYPSQVHHLLPFSTVGSYSTVFNLPSVLLTNPQSLTNCFEEFSRIVFSLNPVVIVVSETWFSSSQPADKFQLERYTLFHDDREARRGGGVGIYFSSAWFPCEYFIKVPPELECLWVTNKDCTVFVCGLYHAPRASTGQQLIDHIVNTVLDIRRSHLHAVFIVAGDFNHLHHEMLFSTVGLCNLVQEPTHAISAIDLILTNAPQLFVRPKLLPPIGRSQHYCIFVEPQKGPIDDMSNLPNVPSQLPYPAPGGTLGGFNIPPGPPPPNPSADYPYDGGNFQASSNVPNWNDNSPPPPYTSVDPSLGLPTMRSISPGNKVNFPPDLASSNIKDSNPPKPSPRSKFDAVGDFSLPDLPSVPDLPEMPKASDPEENNDNDIDFDDLTRRFEELKKKK